MEPKSRGWSGGQQAVNLGQCLSPKGSSIWSSGAVPWHFFEVPRRKGKAVVCFAWDICGEVPVVSGLYD